MAQTKLKLKQVESSATPGSFVAYNASNELVLLAPTTGADRIPFYDDSATAGAFLTLGTNLSISGTTLNATAGAGGYATVQEEGVTVGASNTTINFVGAGITAADAGASVTSVTLNAFLNSLSAAGQSSTVGQTLRVTGASTYAWGALDLADTDAVTGLLPYANIASLTGLSVLGRSTNSSGVMAAVTGTTNQVLRVDAAGTGLSFGAINLAAAAAVTGVLDEANGGTGTSTYAIGDLLYADTTASLARRAAVASGSVLKSAGVSTAPVWGTLASTDLSDTSNIVLLTGNQTISGTKTVTSLTISGTPSAATDAATVGYVTTAIAGLRKGSVRAATTVNGTLATAYENGDVIDGVTLATGDLILLKNQTSQAENGVYTVNVSGAPTRATWMDAASEIDGVYVAVEDGTTLGGTLWITVSEVTTLGTDAIVFTQINTSAGITGSGVNNQIAVWSGTSALDGNSTFTWDQTQMTVGTATPATSVRVTTQGTGTGNTTYGLQHNNSSAAQVFRVADDGTTIFGTGTTSTITGNSLTASGVWTFTAGGVVNMTPGANFNILTGGGQSFAIGGGSNFAGTSGTTNILSLVNANVAPTSGTGIFNIVNLSNTITQTGGANGITRSLLIAPTLTTPFDYRALEITANSSHYALWTTAGKVRFDLGSDAQGDLLVRGSGGNLERIAAGSTAGHVLTSNGSGAAPTYQAAAGSVTVTRAYLTGSTSSVIDLDSGTAVTDIDGANVTFTTSGIAADKIFVVRNGVTLSQSGTVTRDYTLVPGTGVLTLAYALTADENLMVYKIV